MEASVDD